ncbi:MAG: hypothetical protein AAF587_44335 [Bacteroidota bacterium]
MDTLVQDVGSKICSRIEHITVTGDKVVWDAQDQFKWVDQNIHTLAAGLRALEEEFQKERANWEQEFHKLRLSFAAIQTSMDRDSTDFEKRIRALEVASAKETRLAGRLASAEDKIDKAPSRAAFETLHNTVSTMDADLKTLMEDLKGKSGQGLLAPGPLTEGVKEEDQESDGLTSPEVSPRRKPEQLEMPMGPHTAGQRARVAMESIRRGEAQEGSMMSDVRYDEHPREDLATHLNAIPEEEGNPEWNHEGGHMDADGVDHRGASGFGGNGFNGAPYAHAEMPRHSNPLFEQNRNPKIKLPLPEKFSGKKVGQNVALWLRQVQRYCTAMNFRPMETLEFAVGSLIDSAAVWADSKHGMIMERGWMFFEQGLISQFQILDVETVTRDKMESLSFEAGGDIVKFIQSFREHQLQIPDMSDREALQYFQRAMPPDIRQFLRLNMADAPLDAVFNKLQTLASLQASIGSVSGSTVPSLVPHNRTAYVGGSGSGIGDSKGNKNFNSHKGKGKGKGFNRNSGSGYQKQRRGGGFQKKQTSSPHTMDAATHKSPRKSEGSGRKTCYACGAEDHQLSKCPLWAKMREQLKG